MGEHIEKAIRMRKPIPWVQWDRRGRCPDCKGPRHAPWWGSIVPAPSCEERRA